MLLKQLSNANKIYLLAFVACFIFFFEFLSSNYFKATWFSETHNGVAKLDKLNIKVEDSWYPIFNTDENILFKINAVFSSEYSKTKTISFSRYKSNDESNHLIEVDLLSEKMASELNEKVKSHKNINSNIGLLYFVDQWVGRDDNKYIMYFSRKYNITMTTTDELDLMALIEININDSY